MDRMKNNGTYSTTDFWLSGFLKAKGLKIIDVRKESSRSIFIFEDEPRREELTREFYNNGLIEVGLFKSALQDLKSIIHSL